MVDEQIKRRGVSDSNVLAAMLRVPRHRFVPQESAQDAYEDGPLSIGFGQTISQPYVVASMTEQLGLNRKSRVLEIGTGSGYQAAVLGEVAGSVFTIELISELSFRAASLLTELGYTNIRTRVGDGAEGWPESDPFDAIIVTAAASEAPEPLVAQLGMKGVMIIPIQEEHSGRQFLTRIQKSAEGIVLRALYEVRFVPFVKKT